MLPTLKQIMMKASGLNADLHIKGKESQAVGGFGRRHEVLQR